MDKKQVVIIALLAVAIILSSASIMMNISLLNEININGGPDAPSSSNVAIQVLPVENQAGGADNGVG